MVVVFTGGGANTDEIAPFLFKAIRSDAAIAENPAGQQKLAQALARVAEPVSEMANAKTPRLARTVSGTTYSLSPNPLDLRTLQFEFNDQSSAEVTLRFDSASWTAPVGLDGKRRFAPVGPHGLSVATVGRWISDDEFLLDLDTVANVNHFLFSVHFDENKIRIRMNETTGEIKDVIVDGTAELAPRKKLERQRQNSESMKPSQQCTVLAVVLLAPQIAQPPGSPDLEAQRTALRKLEFLVGAWMGEARITRGAGETTELVQTEEAGHKLDGLILVIEGIGRAKSGVAPVLQAFAVISYEHETKTYRMRAFNRNQQLRYGRAQSHPNPLP